MISSLQNPTVKWLRRLRDNRFRQQEQVVVVDGIAEVGRALAAGLQPNTMLYAEPLAADWMQRFSQAMAVAQPASEEVMQKVGFGEHHRQIVAVFEQPDLSLEDLELPANALIVVLDGFEKPGNIGAVLRSADAAGADAVVLSSCLCDRFNPNVIRASLGTVFTVPNAAASRHAVMDWLSARGIAVVTTRVDAPESFWDVNLRDSVAIVIGSEADGLDASWNQSPTLSARNVRIPMQGHADSLNASVSAALLLFEARRQRQRV